MIYRFYNSDNSILDMMIYTYFLNYDDFELSLNRRKVP